MTVVKNKILKINTKLTDEHFSKYSTLNNIFCRISFEICH